MPHTADSAYVTADDLTGLLPAAFITEALDDDGDGVADAGDAVCIAASNEVDSYIGARYQTPVPKASAPAMIIAAAIHLAVDLCYRRRGIADRNPYKDKVDALRKRLEAIAAGKESLDVAEIPGADEDARPVQVASQQAISVPANSRFSF